MTSPDDLQDEVDRLRAENEEMMNCLKKVKLNLATLSDKVEKQHCKTQILHHLHALHSFVHVTIETAGEDIHQ